MILIIDNYDSFTYNLVQYCGELTDGKAIEVFRNDMITPEKVASLNPEKIILSPGPGKPEQAGICLDLLNILPPDIPLLGVCLGHQVIGRAFGGEIRPAQQLMHGKVSMIRHDGEGLFEGLENPLLAGRYHSLAVNYDTVPEVLKITAVSEDSEVMGLSHRELPIHGIQFHPESVLTENGKKVLFNFLKEGVVMK